MFIRNNWKMCKLDEESNIIDYVKIKNHLHEFINYLCEQKITNNNIFIYNIMFPYDQVNDNDKEYIKKMLEPNEEMNDYLNETLNKLELQKKTYNIIHIRTGDNYLNNIIKNFDIKYCKKIIHDVSNIITGNINKNINKNGVKENYLLISDNKEIKIFLCNKFKNIKTIYTDITHMGEGVELEINKVKYLMENSKFLIL